MLQNTGSFEELATFYVLDERRNIDAYRTALHTSWVGAVQTTLGFGHRLFFGIAGVHFFGTGSSTINRVELIHRTTRDSCTFLRLHRLAEFFTPRSLAVEEYFHRSLFFLFSSDNSFRFLDMWFHLANVLFEVRHFFTFHILERTHTLEHFIEIHLVAVEFRTIHANELGLSTYGDTASTTHTGTIHHNRIQRYISRDFVFLGQQAAELHHDSRTDSETLVHLFTLDDTFDTFGHEALGSIRTVIGHNDDFIG